MWGGQPEGSLSPLIRVPAFILLAQDLLFFLPSGAAGALSTSGPVS